MRVISCQQKTVQRIIRGVRRMAKTRINEDGSLEIYDMSDEEVERFVKQLEEAKRKALKDGDRGYLTVSED